MLRQGVLGEVRVLERRLCRDAFFGVIGEELGEEVEAVRGREAEGLPQVGESV